MRMSQDEKARSHARIIASAAKLARQSGVELTSVNDIMKDAGLTHGGFYKHFESKDALLAVALDHAFDEIADRLGPDLGLGGRVVASADFQEYYLSEGHLASPGQGCPVAALSGDVARSTAALKMRFGAGVRRIIALLGRSQTGSEKDRRIWATRQFAMMTGAIMMARACDPETARDVLSACRGDSQ